MSSEDGQSLVEETQPQSSMGPSMPPLTRQAVDDCAFENWFPNFKRVSPKATIIQLTQEFIDYLRADGVFLPGDCDSEPDDASANGDSDDEDPEPRRNFNIGDITQRIDQVIQDYEAVFPKLSWSSPQDAAWMNVGPPLKCTSSDDVLLLLKSSDFVAHDLDFAYDGCVDIDPAHCAKPALHLILKKWFDMPPSHEFRCFVRAKRLIAISQRDTNFYDFLQEPSRQTSFLGKIQSFFDTKIQAIFPQDNYIFDVYITRDEARVFLIDFNPFAERTDSLLFEWDEITGLQSSESLGIRVIESHEQASQTMPIFSHNRYPQDVVGLSDGASIAEFAAKWRDTLAVSVSDRLDQSGQRFTEIPGR